MPSDFFLMPLAHKRRLKISNSIPRSAFHEKFFLNGLLSMSWDEEADLSFKVTILGDAGVGKSCIVNRRCDGTYLDLGPMTVGVATKTTLVKVGRQTIELKIWDTAGQEQYSSLVPMFCRGTEVCVLVADVTRPDTIAHLPRWREHLQKTGADPPVVIALNKADLVSGLTLSQFEEKLGKCDATILVSAKTSFNVDLLFMTCARLAAARKAKTFSKEGESPALVEEKGKCC
jgi:small GTP-binding protein